MPLASQQRDISSRDSGAQINNVASNTGGSRPFGEENEPSKPRAADGKHHHEVEAGLDDYGKQEKNATGSGAAFSGSSFVQRNFASRTGEALGGNENDHVSSLCIDSVDFPSKNWKMTKQPTFKNTNKSKSGNQYSE